MVYYNSIAERCEALASYIIEKKATVREAAEKFGISTSTVHKNVTEFLFKVNPALHNQVAKVLQHNKKERHIRGGEATKRKYKNKIV